MRIGIAFDLAPAARPTDGPDDRFEEFDKPQTIDALARVLEGEGHDVVRLGDGRPFLERVLADPPDLVWNLAEGEGTGRNRESRVPAVLEMLGIPYTGSDPLTLAAALDKSVAKRLIGGGGQAVPRGVEIPPDAPAAYAEMQIRAAALHLPGTSLIVKPAFEGSSKGIRTGAVADDVAGALAIFDRLARDYAQPILIEEFIAGDEVTVGIVGNGAATEVIGAMRIRPKVPDDRFVYSIEVKRDWDERIEYETPARLPDDAAKRLVVAAMSAYMILGCRDLARIDYRIQHGIPYFIEANPLPGLAPDWSDLVILAKGVGWSYADLIRRVLHEARKRTGLTTAAPGGGGT